MKKFYLVHEVDQKVHDAIAEEKHCVNVTEVYFSWEEQETPEGQRDQNRSWQIGIFQLFVLGFFGLDSHHDPLFDQVQVDSDVFIMKLLP